MDTKDETIVDSVRRWLETVIIDLNLCPFAKREYVANKVRFAVSSASDIEELMRDLADELDRLTSDQDQETTLLIHPNVLQDFDDYNQFLDFGDALLEEMDLVGVYQIASFHPHYQFAGTETDDAENYTNRSPYPLLHILREESLEKAIAAHGDVAQIPVRNIELMKSMGLEKISSLWESFQLGH